VEKDFLPGMLQNVYDNSVIASRCLKVPIGAGRNGLRYRYVDETSRADGSRAGGVRAYWEDEADAPTATNPKFGRGELNLVDLKALCYATDDLLEDAAAIEGLLMPQFYDEMSFKLQDAIINGDGSGKPLGILNAPALVSVSGESGQDADTIITENVLNVWKCMPERSRSRAIWLYNQEYEDQLQLLQVAVGTGGQLMKLFNLTIDGNNTLNGRPAFPAEQVPGVGDAGCLICMDPGQYMIIDKGSMRGESSIHVRFIYNETTFRFIYRCNGQPLRHSKITPYKRTDTDFYTSPYVAVAAI
jgi:HK97 family phage major capsid protein